MKEIEAGIKYSFPLVSILGIVSCLLTSLFHIGVTSTSMLIIFNLFFASLIFPLQGTLAQKTCLLLIGNIIGLFCNYLFFLFTNTGVRLFGDPFNFLYIILNPFVNLLWVVPFWSMSLTLLVNSEKRKTGIRIDY